MGLRYVSRAGGLIKGAVQKVEQQRTRALFNALLMHSRLVWNSLQALKKCLWTVEFTIHMLQMNAGK